MLHTHIASSPAAALAAALALLAPAAVAGPPTDPAAAAAARAPAADPAGPDDPSEPPAGADRHRLAPRHVPLVVAEGTRLVAADADDGHDEQDDYAPRLFERLTAEHPGRFRFDDDAGHWRDAEGEYVWDEENQCYWQEVDAATLTRGRQDYVQFCASCHGFEGDGYGRSARMLRPPPRDFRQGLFKFTKVNSEKLPDDEALVALIMDGLDGTPMYPWDISEGRIRDIVTYLKSLSVPEDEEAGTDATGWRDPYAQIAPVVETGDDPWAGRGPAAVEQGEALYHRYQCFSCHPAYATPARTNALRGTDAATTYPDTHTYPKLKADSSYEVLGYAVGVLPPDFTWHAMRRGATARDVYQTIAAGVAGAGMPTWKGSVPDQDIWAIAHYVRHLADTYKDKPAARAAFMRSLRGR